MMRYARVNYYDFIFSLIMMEAANGHFSRKLLNPAATLGMEKELLSVLLHHRRINQCYAYALIWERKGYPVGFVVMSSLEGDQGNELWMAAIAPSYRGLGEGREMIGTILPQFKQQGTGLMARCAPESEAMFHILTTSGFVVDAILEHGTRQLVTSW